MINSKSQNPNKGTSPSVDIILPTYNREHFLGEAIQSVLNQTYKNWQLYIVDDGSTDETEALVKSFSDSRIHYLWQENQGVSVARNKALEQGHSPLIAFIDSDDLWISTKLEKQVAYLLMHPEIALLYGPIKNENIQTGEFVIKPRKPCLDFQELLNQPNSFFIHIQSVMVQRYALKKVGNFDPALWIGEDNDLWLRIAKEYPMAYLDNIFATVRSHGANVTNNNRRHLEGWIQFQTKLLKSFAANLSPQAKKKYETLRANYEYLIATDMIRYLSDREGHKRLRFLLSKNPFLGLGFATKDNPWFLKLSLLIRPYLYLILSFFPRFLQRGMGLKRKSKAHVVLITENYLPHFGGSRIYYHQLAKGFSSDYEMLVITRKNKVAGEFDRSAPYKIIRSLREKPPVGLIQELMEGLSFFVALIKTHLKSKIDLIIVGETQVPAMAALLMHWIFRVPYVSIVHGEELTITQRLNFEAKWQRFVLTHAQSIIAASSFAKSLLLKMKINEEKIVVVNPGVDKSAIQKPSDLLIWKQQQGINGERILLSVGRLVERKGHSTVLRALPKVLEKVPNLCYVIVGKGPLDKQMKEQVAELGLENQVRFVEGISDDMLNRWYWLCDLFVLPNKTLPNGDAEGFGMVFLEASARGKPVIGGKSGGTYDAILDQKTGILTDPEDVGLLADHLQTLLTHPAQAERFGAEGKKRVEAEFFWSHQINKIKQVTKPILDAKQVTL